MNKLPVYHQKGIAFDEYNPVCYFQENRPSKGLRWKFKSAKNLHFFQH